MKSAMIPCKFNLEQMEHPNLLKCRLKVAKTGKNWNGSKFSIESFKKAESTLKNIPILAYIKQTDEDKYDFDGHNIEMRTTETPNKIVTKFHYLERLIEECNQHGTKLVFAISPSFGADDDRGYNPLKELCARYDIPLINHFCDPEFTSSTEYFYDSVHLNRTGATKYTKKLIGELKELLLQE